MIAKVSWIILIFSTWLNIIVSGLSQSNQNFSDCDPSKQFSHKSNAGLAKILICAGEKNGVPQWQYTDGSSTLGEVFNPAGDCSDIVDHFPGAVDGFYWIYSGNKTKNNVEQVWCDVHTDGGGFMLVGMKDNPVSWTVPSNSKPVDPQGPPHWSSVLGNSTILDFGIQFSSKNRFEGAEAHWLYRMKQKRQLGKLFTNDISKGCGTNDPGIGDVTYVKDVLTGTVMTTNFKCSIFGPHTHPELGWARMNYCLRHSCKNGYGVIPGPFIFKYAQYGSFSYSAVSASSGLGRNSTAFIGCDNGKCCACFGPKGGRQNYCGTKCTAINGGRIIKKVFVWFWVRSRMPERLWKKCMEFMKKNSAGELEKHFINPQTGTAQKGSCSEQFKTFLNEGTLTVADKGNFENVPDVPGLLSYREDNKQLYVNEGSKWQALGTQEQVEQLRKEQKSEIETLKEELLNKTDKALVSQDNELKELESKVKRQEMNTNILEQQIKSQGTKIQEQEKKIQTQTNQIYSQEIKIQTQEIKIKIQEKDNQYQNSIIQNQTIRLESLENKYQDIIDRLRNVGKPRNFSVLFTCTAIRQKYPALASGIYFVNYESVLFPIYCDMTSKNGNGVTVFGHDSEYKIEVNGFEKPQSYRRKINYGITVKQIAAIVDRSQKCEQFIKYECLNAGYGSFENPYSVWISRQGSQMRNWGGAVAQAGGRPKCACGKTNSCRKGAYECNCGPNDNVWAEDSGFLTDKKLLPVTELRFGDTSTTAEGYDERGYHTLGKLLCWG